MTDRKAALEALDRIAEDLESLGSLPGSWIVEDIALIRAALSEPAAEPVAWMRNDGLDKPVAVVTTRIKELWRLKAHENMVERYTIPLYAAPPAQEGAREDARDAARYRWLRAQHGVIDPFAAVVWAQWHGPHNDVQWRDVAGPEQLDAAIDTAMSAAPKPEEKP